MTGLKMTTSIDLQNDDCLDSIPSPELLKTWVNAALQQSYANLEQTIRVVGEVESGQLNEQFRNKPGATNILSFPDDSTLLEYDCLGDLVICAAIVEAEARQQAKPVEAHWAHMVVHGMLHLQGFDHQQDIEATEMENLEINILATLGYANPYNDATTNCGGEND